MTNFQETDLKQGLPDTEGSIWFKRLHRECENISPHIRFKRIKHGFYRIYWKQAYLKEVYKEMTANGYDWDDTDLRLIDKNYYEEYEDRVTLTRKLKNFVEGYYDAIERIRTRTYLMRNNKEFYKSARNAYKQ